MHAALQHPTLAAASVSFAAGDGSQLRRGGGVPREAAGELFFRAALRPRPFRP